MCCALYVYLNRRAGQDSVQWHPLSSCTLDLHLVLCWLPFHTYVCSPTALCPGPRSQERREEMERAKQRERDNELVKEEKMVSWWWQLLSFAMLLPLPIRVACPSMTGCLARSNHLPVT